MTPSSSKRKRVSARYDQALGRLFGFTSSDLDANSAGLYSLRQWLGVPLWLDRITHMSLTAALSQLLPGSMQATQAVHHQRRRIATSAEIREFHSAYRVDIESVCWLHLQPEVRFRITPQQRQLIQDGVTYDVYYDVAPLRVLSLARVEA